jgi:hypothetical protein
VRIESFPGHINLLVECSLSAGPPLQSPVSAQRFSNRNHSQSNYLNFKTVSLKRERERDLQQRNLEVPYATLAVLFLQFAASNITNVSSEIQMASSQACENITDDVFTYLLTYAHIDIIGRCVSAINANNGIFFLSNNAVPSTKIVTCARFFLIFLFSPALHFLASHSMHLSQPIVLFEAISR